MNGDSKTRILAIEEASNFIKTKINPIPKVAVMFSSELDTLSDILAVKRKVVIPYSEIPRLPKMELKNTRRQLVFGYLYRIPVLILQGKPHLYEGHSLQECTMMVYVLRALGVKFLILGNTASAINSEYNVGDVMIIKRHVYLTDLYDLNPFEEQLNERDGPKFGNREKIYNKTLMDKSKEILAKDLGFKDGVRMGTYAFLPGPTYETLAETKFLKALGADAAGMCIVPEVLAAKRCGLTVFAFSLLTNVCGQEEDPELNHDDVIQISNERSTVLKIFVEKLLDYLNVFIVGDQCSGYGKKISVYN